MKSIPKTQVSARLKADNPWWNTESSTKLPFSDLEPRPYIDRFYPLMFMKVQRAVVLMGPRRVGKTVMIYHTIQKLIDDNIDTKSICYISVDHPLYNGLGLEEILEQFSALTGVDYRIDNCYLFFDEIQYLRDWEVHVKGIVDRYPDAQCIASGSAAAALRLKSNESGAGRFTDFLLPPLTFYEYLVLLGRNDLIRVERDENGNSLLLREEDIEELNEQFIKYVNFGGYPEVALSSDIQSDPARFIKNDIIDKVLLRDLPSLYGISDVQELNHLFTTLAFNTANEVSLEGLSKNSGVAKSTLRRYMEYLEAAFLIRIVHRVDRSAKRFKRANYFKVYLTNPSMHTALFGIVNDGDLQMGALVETAIFSQWFHTDHILYYARWNNGEVDVVGMANDQHVNWALEIKWSDRYYDSPHELKSLIDFCHAQNLTNAWITSKSISRTKVHSSVSLNFYPASLYCYQLGYSFVKGTDAIQ